MIDRADRLHLVLAQLRGVPYLSPEEAFAMTPLTPVGMATVEEVTTEDLALATELINIEAELREKEYNLARSLRPALDVGRWAEDGLLLATAVQREQVPPDDLA
jgi:hypothetical protein